MSNIIHMETERVRQVASDVIQSNNQVENRIASLSSIVNGLPWEGGDREQFVSDFTSLVKK
jgi:uncharacterized protein YukE